MSGDIEQTSGPENVSPAEHAEVADDSFLSAWERRTGTILVAAAIAPLAAGLAGTRSGDSMVGLDLVSWAIFVVDYVVHLRHRRGYVRSRLGLFDLGIVVFTAPWYLIPGAGVALTFATRLGRLGRLGRVFLVSSKQSKLRDLARRLGAAALYSIVLMIVCALVVRAVEPPSSGFLTFGDSMWWSIVTFTTVGYGDLYPVTTPGRLAGVLLMVGGVALIGSLAGTLGSFFSPGDDPEIGDVGDVVHPADGPPADGTPSAGSAGTGSPMTITEATATQLLAELQRLRAEVAQLRRAGPGPDSD